MLFVAAETADIVIAAISTISAIAVAGISAWAAVTVARATNTQATRVAELERENAELKQQQGRDE